MSSAEKAVSEKTDDLDSLNKEATEILSRVADDATIIVTPNSFMMQHGNDSLFLRSAAQKNLYHQMLENEAERSGWVVGPEKLSQLKDPNCHVILLKISALAGQDPLGKCARIWHEYGHKIDAAETGDVFAHEVSRVAENLGKEAAQEWLRRTGVDGATRLVYIARTSTTKGIEKLAEILTGLLTAEELVDFQKIRDSKTKK